MDEALYHAFFHQEEEHWWFAARTAIVREVLRVYGNLSPGETLLDIGCGTGAMLKALASTYRVIGIDTSNLAVKYSRARGLHDVYQMKVHEFPRDEFKVKTALLLDVIEHVQDDVDILRQARNVIEPDGRVVVTVPAHMWLWSGHDVVNQHYRRYSKASLQQALARAGLTPVKLTFFNTLLFPAVVAAKILSRARGGRRPHVTADERIAPGNMIVKAIFESEKYLIPRMTLPTGVSLLAVARPMA